MSETDYEKLWLSMWRERDEARLEIEGLRQEVDDLRRILHAAQWLLDPERLDHKRLLRAVERTMPKG